MPPRTRPRRRTRQTAQTPWRARATLFLPLRSWRLQLIAAAAGVIVAVLSAQSFASANETLATYLIQPGDTLSGIATSTGVSIERLINFNSIKNPDIIIAGQTLSLSAAAPSGQTDATQYMVKEGDTLWSIAQTNGTTIESLIQMNSLANPDQLSVGQVVRLPVVASVQLRAAAAATAKPKSSPTPKPSPTPKATPTVSPLQQKVAAEAQRVGGANVHVGLAATNLITGEKINLHPEDTFPSASVMKLPILVELERQIAAGNVAWTESLRAEASAMVAISDNTAANQIADIIHPQSVNDTLAKLSLSGTHFANLFNDARSPSNPGGNQTTPANMAHLLELIATDQIVNAQVSGDIRTLLARNTDRSKLARLLPPDARLQHKSGWYEGVANDVGIVNVERVPTRWVIAVFTENDPDTETGNQIVAVISKAVYDAWATP